MLSYQPSQIRRASDPLSARVPSLEYSQFLSTTSRVPGAIAFHHRRQVGFISETICHSVPIHFRPLPIRGRWSHNVEGERAALLRAATNFRAPALQEATHGGPGNRFVPTQPRNGDNIR